MGTNDRTIVTARIRTMDRPGAPHDWMAFRAGLIEAVGRGEPPGALRECARTLDLGGRTVLPALHDAHVHFMDVGLMELDVDLSAAESFDEVLEMVGAAARSFDGRIMRCHSFDPDLIPDGRYPTASELDQVAGAVPTFVKRRDGHSGVANSAGLAFLDLDPEVSGVAIDETGRPTGVLRRRAYTLAARAVEAVITAEERAECYRRAASLAASRGIGVVHALVGSDEPENRDVEILVETADALPIDVVIYPQFERVDRVRALGLPRIGGCLMLDGSFSSGTAALSAPYADGGGRGPLYYTDEFLIGLYRDACEHGLQVAVHALGGRAIDQAVSCMETACGSDAVDLRFRIEHFELPTPADVDAMLRLGAGASVQPTFELLWGGPDGMYAKRLGAARAARSNPFRTLLAAGMRLAGGSDCYVTPMDSLLGIDSAVNRPNEGERLSVFQAASLFTSGAAWFSFDEERRGTLEAGKEASFVVLDDDPFEVDASVIREIGVAGLFVRGSEVSGASG